jgi:hypothetical protein
MLSYNLHSTKVGFVLFAPYCEGRFVFFELDDIVNESYLHPTIVRVRRRHQ